MQRTKTVKGSHWTINHLPERSKSPFRLRWKRLKTLGSPSDPDFRIVHYFEKLEDAKSFASRKIEDIQSVGKLVNELEPSLRTRILREAARLAESGIDPIKAMEEGARHLKAYGEKAETTIGSFWPAYVARKKADGKWGARNLKAQESFFEATEDTLMNQPVKNFIHVSTGQEIVRNTLKKYQSQSERNAANTLRGAKSKIRGFLSFVASEVDALNLATLKEIFSHQYLLPAGLRAEAKNVAINTDQAKYLIGFLASRKLAGWIVFKLFMGARTLLLQQWKWSVVDWQNDLIQIPRNQTKLKQSNIRFHISEIPNFSDWLKWAWEIDGKPEPEKPIARFSQPTITNLVRSAINEKRGKELFDSVDKRKKIKPAECLRNFMRSGFITYGTQIPELGVGKVMKIAEDAHNLHKYLAWDSATGKTPEAERYWSLKPDAITLETPPQPKRRQRKQTQTANAALTR
jgi:hypothetical protein